MNEQRGSREMPPLPPMLKQHNPPAAGDLAQLYTSDQMYSYGRECMEWARLRVEKEFDPVKGAADMLTESAKQHRQRGDTGHAEACDAAARTLRTSMGARR